MDLIFDIDQDELPIFLAETEEQLQILDEGLIELERNGENMDLIQVLFRAAHTLKGTSGMIGHKRMVSLTHALEAALDGLRKHTVMITPSLVDLCLEAVDAIRALREEVVLRKASAIDVEYLTERFAGISTSASAAAGENKAGSHEASVMQAAGIEHQNTSDAVAGGKATIMRVHAIISPSSVASAARALQIVLALQELGKIIHMHPTQEEIETAKPVYQMLAIVQTLESRDAVLKSLSVIGDIDQLAVEVLNGGEVQVEGKQETASEAVASVADKPAETGHAPQATEGRKSSIAKSMVEKTVRTSVERLDNLMNLVGELITDRNRLYQIRSHFDARFSDDKVDVLSETVAHIGRITDQLQKEVMGIRMLPVSNVFNKFPRMIRDLAANFNKKVDLVIQGEDTELDRSVIEEITDPLIHLLRNSVDHGVEPPSERVKMGKPERATILLTARHEQGRILLTVEDDGGGINCERVKNTAIRRGLIGESEAATMPDDEAVNLIFTSGFSTASAVSDVSGRGVGLDIVRNNIQRLNGTVMVESWAGRGTRFQITLPLTLAIVPTLLVKVAKHILAIPLVTVLETLRVSDQDTQTVNGRPVIRLRDKVLPLLNIREAFNITKDTDDGFYYIVVVASGKHQMGLMVNDLLGQEEVVVKSLGPLVGDLFGIASAAILGDGQVILILDIQDLFRSGGSQMRSKTWEN